MFNFNSRPEKPTQNNNFQYYELLTIRRKEFKDLEKILKDAEKYDDIELIEVRDSLLEQATKHIEKLISKNKQYNFTILCIN